MTPQHLEQLIRQGEGVALEFKQSREIAAAPQVTPQVTQQVTQQVTGQVKRVELVLEYCRNPRTRSEIQLFVGMKDRGHFRSEVLQPLLEKGLLLMTIPEKPNSSKQRYITMATP